MKSNFRKRPFVCRKKRRRAIQEAAQSHVAELLAAHVYLPGQAMPAAYLCPFGRDHWHVGTSRFAQDAQDGGG